ncbi:SWIM zinc finger family protein [Streptomyces sp. NPDC002309]
MNQHDETERTFAASPPTRGRGFALTWWGRAWLKALEDAALDGEQVKTGRRLARAGAVGAVSVRPGRVTAVVRDRDGTAHRADVTLEELTAGQWDRFLTMAVERAGHVAALLDREMPPHLVEDAAAAGVELLPGMGALEPTCDCGAWDHCGHTAALCYQVARLLDEDPFVLLLMRGRGARALLGDLQTRIASPAREGAAEHPELTGVDALEAYAAGDILPPLPAPPGIPAEPGLPPSLDTEAPPAAGVDPAALEFLAARTAVTAHRLLSAALQGDESTEELTVAQDAVRLAAGAPEPILAERIARGSGRSPGELSAAVLAWQYGGVAGLSVLEEEWAVEGESLARARAALNTAWDDDERPALRARGNRWTLVGSPRQLRLGRDGRWWPYRNQAGRWMPVGGGDRDPATALAATEDVPAQGAHAAGDEFDDRLRPTRHP